MIKGKLILFPHPLGHGGPSSFQIRFEKASKVEGFEIAYVDLYKKPDAIFVEGDTKRNF